MNKISLVSIIVLFSVFVQAKANIRLPKVIGSNMVLQQRQPVKIWGWGDPGEEISLSFAGQNLKQKCNSRGEWQFTLKPMGANSKPQEMTVAGRTDKITLGNILIGEVWLCSGQSNMEYPMKKKAGYVAPKRGIDSTEIDLQKSFPTIRLFNVQKKISGNDVVSTGWENCEGTAFEQTSAMGFYFAKALEASLNVPIGIITSAWGGSRIEPWTDPEAYRSSAIFADNFTKDTLKIDGVVPGVYFKGMIAPLAPFAIKGVLWYQGESNCIAGETHMRYANKMQALIMGWRKQFNQPKLPFYYVLVAPHTYTRRSKGTNQYTTATLPLFWEQQVAASAIPNTGFITVSDLVDVLTDIHPSYKWTVGKRMAALALNKSYGKKQTYLGPQVESVTSKDDQLVVSFKNAKNLSTNDGDPASTFEIAGSDGVFYAAKALINKNTINLTAKDVPHPTQMRFAWFETAQPNLVNEFGLPAVPYRSNGEVWQPMGTK